MVIFILIVLMLCNAVFAAAEIAVISANHTKLSEMSDEGNKKAKRLIKLTEQPARFLTAIRTVITLAGFIQSALAAQSFAEPLVIWLRSLGISAMPDSVLQTTSTVAITLALVFLNLVLGELVPKRIAMHKADSFALGISGTLYTVTKIFIPFVWLLNAAAKLVLKLLGINPDLENDRVTEEEILMLVKEGGEQGTILETENEIIQNVFEFNDIIAKDIATHRVNVDILWLEDSGEVWAETIHKTRHTRYPVCNESADDVVGILNAKDYFRLESKDRNTILKEAVSPAYFVPETITADVLFRNMKSTRNSLAVIIDERGGMEGIITIYDLIEELVGDLNDEEENPEKSEPTITKIADGKWKVNGNISLEELEEETGLSFPTDEYETLTGLAFDKLGIIPSDGEQKSVEVTLPEAKILITRVLAHQIDEATITLL